jgi:hypothetical protein
MLARLGESLVGIAVQPLLLVLGYLRAVALVVGTLWLLLLLCLLKPEKAISNQCCSGSPDPYFF